MREEKVVDQAAVPQSGIQHAGVLDGPEIEITF